MKNVVSKTDTKVNCLILTKHRIYNTQQLRLRISHKQSKKNCTVMNQNTHYYYIILLRNNYKSWNTSSNKTHLYNVGKRVTYLTCFFFWYRENHQIAPPIQGGAEGSVRLLARYAVSRLNGSRGPGRHLARYRVLSFRLTALWGPRGTQRAVDS